MERGKDWLSSWSDGGLDCWWYGDAMAELRHLYLITKGNEVYFTIADGVEYRGGQSTLKRAFNYTDYKERIKENLEDAGYTVTNILPLAFWDEES